MKASIKRAFGYMETKKSELAVGREFDTSDFHGLREASYGQRA